MEETKEEDGELSIHLETHSSSSSSSSSSYLSPPKNLPISPTDSPPVQVMDRDDGDNENVVDQEEEEEEEEGMSYDPNRIPSSVFERSKSNVPAEWSCTSNESLFSIHLGRNSFYGNDLMKSGELYKSGELLAYSPELPMPPPPGSESSKPVEYEKEEEVVVEVVVVEEEEDKRESHEKEEEEEQHPAVSWKTPKTSYRSTHSSNSAHSFSFPMYSNSVHDSVLSFLFFFLGFGLVLMVENSLAGAASESRKEEQKKQAKGPSQEIQQQEAKAEEEKAVSNQKQSSSSSMCRWFSCFPPCPWCCSSHSPCSCS